MNQKYDCNGVYFSKNKRTNDSVYPYNLLKFIDLMQPQARLSRNQSSYIINDSILVQTIQQHKKTEMIYQI